MNKGEIKMFEINIPTLGLQPFQVEDLTNKMQLKMITSLFEYVGYDFRIEKLLMAESKEVKLVASIKKL